jgi:hypothetical protein
MSATGCHASNAEPLTARAFVRKTLGVKRVADWCGVGEAAVYQWLSRRSEESPIPPRHVPAVIAGVRRAGLKVDLSQIWPELAVQTATAQ